MAYEYQFGATLVGMVNLNTLVRAAPLSGYRPYAQTIKPGDGTLMGQGFPVITWHWAFITVAERDNLIGDMGAALSVAAFVRTRLPDNTWATFQCIQHRPTGEENLQVGKIVGFDIEFTHCVLTPEEE